LKAIEEFEMVFRGYNKPIMNPFETEYISKIFFTNPANRELIGSRESSTLEFKQNFILEDFDVAGYARVMASFSNKEGGYLVFGVEDKPRKLVGISSRKFDSYDPALFADRINNIFQPEIEWSSHLHNWLGRIFGIIYTYPSTKKPTIATKNISNIQEGDIYYRYNGRSERIKYPELVQIINERVSVQDAAWRHVFEKAAKIGPLNTAVMDTVEGTISGEGGTIIIDEELANKLKFIREGHFSENKGAPTLKLVGDVVAAPVSAVRERKVTIGKDIYTYRPKQISKLVETKINKGFSVNLHTKAWKMYKIRPGDKRKFKTQYCEYKEAENDYRYSYAWIDFLVDKLKSSNEYKKLIKYKV
jgi:hypothetical protein